MDNMLKFIVCIGALILLSLISLLFSPYGANQCYAHKAIISEVCIDAPASDIYQYLGKSSNATSWSTFVKLIEPLNDDLFEDGKEGSLRRCFAKDTSIIWDEKITKVEFGQMRRLQIIDPRGFLVIADNLVTEQLYTQFDTGRTRLSLTLYFDIEKEIDFFSEIKMYLAAYQVNRIFNKNLENIKTQIESV